MRRSLLITLLICFPVFVNLIIAQDIPAKPKMILTGEFRGISKPLRDIPPMSPAQYQAMLDNAKKRAKNTPWDLPTYPNAATALPKGPDAVWQKSPGTMSAGSRAPIQNFEGQTSPYYPPDCNGTAGLNHYMQTVNTTYAIYSKTGTLLAGPTNMNLLFGSVTGANYNDGDPIILYDDQADRWLAVEFSVSGSNDYMLIAVSTTNDPTGTWYQYSFDVVDMPDYEKMAVWRDGYYMGTNTQPTTGNDIYVFERSQMLIGGTARMVAFDNPYRPGTGVVVVPPVDNDGVAAPDGTPGTFIAFNDDAVSGGDQLWLYELAVNWTTPASSTFNRTQQITVSDFDSQFSNGWDNIPQPGTTMKLCAISTVIMNVPQYRNFGTYQSIVCCHTVDVDGTDHAGVRWYELRKTPPATTWTLRQQGTYAPDGHNRWMGSIAMNSSNKIAIGYSLSSSTEYPGIRYAGQSSAGYANATGILDVPEVIAHTGTNYQYTYNRWGDYSSMSIDPTDNQTFWFTSQYIGTSETRRTKIISFQIGSNPLATTLAASAITSISATLNGTVNPNGLATSYHFEYGTSTSYGYNTTTISAGSGTSNISVNANISGLITGTPYHFRLVAVNSDGTTNGNDVIFIPGGAVLSTTAATSITQTTATSGGNITSDGGSSITARGVCWATTADPVATGLHTTDGSGSGSFSSSITGLLSNTVYHVRAYATNATGTYYGSDLTFTTLCGTISSFPWNEGFENAGVIPNCWTQEQIASSGINWTFITGSGNSHPAAAHGGTYNACLKDNSATDNKTRLITPTINLSAISSPVLTFWHTQAVWSPDQDQLIVFYKNSAGGTWTAIGTYTANITTWTMETINLPNSSSDYYIAFEGNAKYGYGVCVDDISITGTPSSPTLAVSPSNQNVAPPAGSTAFTVTSNSAWTVVSNQTWCTVTPSGNGNGTITATFTQNNTAASRSANVTVTVTGLNPVVVTVTQAAPTLAVTPANQNVSPVAGSTTFTVTTNSTWAAVSSQTWCTVTPSGTGNGTITATFTQNNTAASRSANVTVTVTGLSPVVVTVTQAAPTLAVTPANQNVSPVAGSTTFAVTTNSTWTAASNQTWCTVTPSGTGNGTITASFTDNNTATQRIANVTVTTPGLTPIVVTVTQAAPTLSVTPSDQNVAAAAGSTTFGITSNAYWTVTSNQTWCTVTPSGTGNGNISAGFTENISVTPRVASITVTVNGLTPIVVTVSQAGANPTLSVTPANQDVSENAGSVDFSVSSNSTWTAISDQTWCTVTPSGSGNGSITASFSLNLTSVARTASISVSASGASPVIVTINQAGQPESGFLTSIHNVVQSTPTRLEFDIYLLDTDPAQQFVLAGYQAGIYINPAILPAGASVSVGIFSNALYSQLNPSQQPTSVVYDQAINSIKLAGRTPVGVGFPTGPNSYTPSGTIIGTSGNGTRVCRIRVGSSLPFVINSQADLEFFSSEVIVPLYASRVSFYDDTNATIIYNPDLDEYEWGVPPLNTQLDVIPGVNAIVSENPLLNPPPTLEVTPANQDVTYPAGTTSFTVVSNTSWSANSDQTWCTVTASGYGNGTIAAVFDANNTNLIRIANITVAVAGLPNVIVTVTQEGITEKVLNLSLLLEGLYGANGIMNPAMNATTEQWGANIADHITVELHDAGNYTTVVHTVTDVTLFTDGTASVTFPAAFNGSYYLTILHRNSIEITSKFPVSFSASVTDYSFDLPDKAFGNNLKPLYDGNYAIFGGDVNQDGTVDIGDLTPVDNAQLNFTRGYVVTDINGDGTVDIADFSIIDNNMVNFIKSLIP